MMRKKWIGGILAALVVGGVGGAVAADDSGQVESIRSSGAQQAEGLRAQLRQARSDSAAAAQHAHDADARADAAGRRARTAEKRARRAALRAIADRDRELDARASDLDSRERKVSGMERDW